MRPDCGEKRWRVKWVNGGDAEGLKPEDDAVEIEAQTRDEEFGKRATQRLQDPKEPSKEEREEHEKTHLPYRSWCRHCVRGRGKHRAHRDGAQEVAMNEIHLDYGFLGKEDEAKKTIPILVAKERTTKMMMAATVPRKTTGAYVQKRVVGFLREVGCLHRCQVRSGTRDQRGGRERGACEGGGWKRQVHHRALTSWR